MEKEKEPMTLTVEQAAYELQLNTEVVRRWLRSGQLPGKKIGRQWRISRKQLERFIQKGK